MKKSAFVTILILALVFTYAIVRYHVFAGVPWSDLPIFISNKAISLSAVVFISLSYALGSLARLWPKVFASSLGFRKFFGLFGFGLGALHGLMSLLIFTPAYYPKFFLESGRLNLTGELSMLFGVLAFFVFALVAISSLPSVAQSLNPARWLVIQRFGYFGLVLIFLHVFTMGFQGWLKSAGWPGGLIPISLIAASVIAFVLVLKIAALFFPHPKA